MILPFFHTCFCVPDLVVGMHQYGETMALDWAQPHKQLQSFECGDGSTIQRTINVTYSLQGPPYIELIEATGWPWSVESTGLHHVALWCADVGEDERRLVARGGIVELRRVVAGDAATGFVYVRMPDGVRIELVDERRKPAIDAWVSGSEFH